MTRKLAILGAAVLILAGLFVTGGIALAQGSATPTPAAPAAGCGMTGGGYGVGMRGGSNMFTVVAELLGLTPAQLTAELQSGKTLLEVAQAHGKTAQEVVAAVMAPRIEQINAAVAAGRLTQAQADQMIATMTENMTEMLESGACTGTCGAGLGQQGQGTTGGRGGMMGGRGGMMGGRGLGNAAPNAQGARTL